MAENWTDLAPHPEAIPAGKTWHVFVSYRSVNRPWVLALYDILNGLGYKVFLDQYVLTAAAPLALSLGEALDSSQSAVLVWSGSYEDSAWCNQEAAKLETMQNAMKGFRYVIARVDDSGIVLVDSGNDPGRSLYLFRLQQVFSDQSVTVPGRALK